METYDPDELAKKKQDQRDQDAADLASGKKTNEELRAQNGLITGGTPRWDLAEPLEPRKKYKKAPPE